MHCIHCGTPLPENAKFCTACGRPVQAAPVEENPAGEGTVCEGTGEDTSEGYTAPENASEGYKAANAQLPASYSNPNYSSGSSSTSATPSTTNTSAIAGFVCSLVFFPLGLGALTAIAGLILSIMGLGTAKTLPERKGHGLALAGVIISAIRIAITIILLIALVALMFRGVGHVGHEIFSNWSQYNPYNF